MSGPKPGLQVDMVVLGAGMAGLTAAAVAARAGREVIVLERGPAIGGSAAFSAGYLWTAPDVDTLWRVNPTGDRALCAALVTSYPDALQWVKDVGAAIVRPVSVAGFGRGWQIDVIDYLRRCAAIVRNAGGNVLCGVEPRALVRTADGVAGVRVKDREGETAIGAPATILATGGFQANPSLRGRYIHPNAEHMLLRSNPQSDGAGMRLAAEAGGALVDRMSGFYGHLICAPTTHFTPTDFLELSQYYSVYGVLLNRAGERFTDESRGDHFNSQAVVRQAGGQAVLICDERVRAKHVLGQTPDGNATIDRFATAIAAGARFTSAGSLPELAGLIAPWGIDERRARETLARYNAAADAGSQPTPPRGEHFSPLREPPFYAIEVQGAITFTHGGIRINDQAQVLTTDGAPIRGLFAAGADAGGTYDGAYAGGLALGCVFGMRAARSACAGDMKANVGPGNEPRPVGREQGRIS